jgi:hypothetical protein
LHDGCPSGRCCGATEAVVSGRFELAPHAYYSYIPRWSDQDDPYKYSGLEVYMAGEKKYPFNVKEKSQKRLTKFKFFPWENRLDFGDVQILLDKNHFFAMKEPIIFISEYLGLDSPWEVEFDRAGGDPHNIILGSTTGTSRYVGRLVVHPPSLLKKILTAQNLVLR